MHKSNSVYLKSLHVFFLCLYICITNLAFANVSKKIELKVDSSEELMNIFQTSLFKNKLVPVDHPTVEYFRNRYLNKDGLEYLSKIMQKSLLYRGYIVEQLYENDMPIELLFLPVIESGFNERAVSKSGAVGIWQFMRNSVGGYDIAISDWVDERKDPWKTTDAAIKKLRYNYAVLGDWCLALAAYNCGLGAVKNAIKRAGKADYWYLSHKGYLPKETVYYVPKFLAIAEILTRSHELGIDWGDYSEYYDSETIEIKRAVDLALLADELDLSAEVLQKLNPALSYNITPADAKYLLRIPSTHRDESLDVLAKTDKILIHYYIYKVRSGDTLYALSKHYGVSISTILSYNKGINPNILRLGQKLMIPALYNVGAYNGRRKETALNFNGAYKVQKGDTLWSIAIKYEVDVEVLATENNMDINAVLSIGKVLKVPKSN